MAAEYPHGEDRAEIEGRKGGEVAARPLPATATEAGPYRLNRRGAFSAGMVATAALGALLYLLPLLFGAPPIDMAWMLGTLIAPGIPNAFWAGLLWFFANGVVWAFVYAGLLLALQKESEWVTGLAYGAALWLAAMLLIPAMMAEHPLVEAGQVRNWGAFLRGISGGWLHAGLALIAHLVFGLLLGVLYENTRREA